MLHFYCVTLSHFFTVIVILVFIIISYERKRGASSCLRARSGGKCQRSSALRLRSFCASVRVKINFLPVERKSRTGEYLPEVVAVRSEESEVRIKTTEWNIP